MKRKDIKKEYEKCLLERSGPFPDLKVIWDCGNGATGEIISNIVKKLPGIHKILFAEIDGNFPNHHPDPTDESTLKIMLNKMKEVDAELGNPNCKLINPVVFESLEKMKPLVEASNDTEFMIRSEDILTIADPAPEVIAKYKELTS